MDAKELAEAVRKVRDLQKLYFKKRSSAVLEESKQAERELDKAVDAILNPRLFD